MPLSLPVLIPPIWRSTDHCTLPSAPKEPGFNDHDPDWRGIRANYDNAPLLVDDAIVNRSLENRSFENKRKGVTVYLCRGQALTQFGKLNQHLGYQ